MYTIALTQGIKSRLYSILENGIEIVRSLSKKKALILEDKLNGNTRSLPTCSNDDLQSNSSDDGIRHQTRCNTDSVLDSSIAPKIQSISISSKQLQKNNTKQPKQRPSTSDCSNSEFRELHQQISNSELPDSAKRTFTSLVNSQCEQYQLNNEQYQLNNEQYQLNNEQYQLNCQLASISYGLINTVNNMGNALGQFRRSDAPTSSRSLEPTTIDI